MARKCNNIWNQTIPEQSLNELINEYFPAKLSKNETKINSGNPFNYNNNKNLENCMTKIGSVMKHYDTMRK